MVLASLASKQKKTTWTSSFGTYARLDYVAVQSDGLTNVVECGPDYEIDLTMNAWEDHNVVACRAIYRNTELAANVETRSR